jgi:amino acid permease
MLRAGQHLDEAHMVAVVKEDRSIDMIRVAAAYDWWPQEWVKALYCVPTFGVSYLCHFNALSTHRELVRPTRYRVRKMLVITFALTSVLYFVVGGAGYLYAGACTCGNILLNFRRDDALVTVGRAALGMVLMLNFPLIIQPCRNALYRLFSDVDCRWCLRRTRASEAAQDPETRSDGTPLSDAQGVRSLEDQGRIVSDLSLATDGSFTIMNVPLVTDGEPAASGAMVHVYRSEDMGRNMVQGETMTAFDAFRPKDDTVQQSAGEMSTVQRYVLTSGLLCSSLAVSCVMKSIMVVWSLLGSTVCFLIMFILPGAFWYRLVGPYANPCRRCAAGLLVGVSSVAAIVCFSLTCYYIHTTACPITCQGSKIA